jgi:cobalamin biosynthesis Mg chelatase CobN
MEEVVDPVIAARARGLAITGGHVGPVVRALLGRIAELERDLDRRESAQLETARLEQLRARLRRAS